MHSLAALVICSAVVAPLINVESGNADINTAFKITATVLSITVTILTGMRQGFKWTEKWKHHHNSAEALKTEGELFAGLAGVYSNFRSHEKAFPTFIQNANAIRSAQLAKYIKSVADDNANSSNNDERDGASDGGQGKTDHSKNAADMPEGNATRQAATAMPESGVSGKTAAGNTANAQNPSDAAGRDSGE